MDDLLIHRADGHAVLTLNRPDKRNALSVALRDAISDALDSLTNDETIKCVIFTGAGTVFCAGFDLSEFTRAADDQAFGRELWASSDRYHNTVLRYPLPTIAAINGPALAVHLVGEVVEPNTLVDATKAAVARVCAMPRDVLLRTKAKALRRAGFDGESPTLAL